MSDGVEPLGRDGAIGKGESMSDGVEPLGMSHLNEAPVGKGQCYWVRGGGIGIGCGHGKGGNRVGHDKACHDMSQHVAACRPHLAEGDLAVVGSVPRVADQHLAVVLDPARAAQHVVDARGHLVPLEVVPGPAGARGQDGDGDGGSAGGEAPPGAGVSPWQLHVDGAHRDDLQGLAPELILPPHVYGMGEWEGVRPPHVPLTCPQRPPQHPPCQKMKLSDSAWQAEMGGWWQTWMEGG